MVLFHYWLPTNISEFFTLALFYVALTEIGEHLKTTKFKFKFTNSCFFISENTIAHEISKRHIWVTFSWRDIIPKTVIFFQSLTVDISYMVLCREPNFLDAKHLLDQLCNRNHNHNNNHRKNGRRPLHPLHYNVL